MVWFDEMSTTRAAGSPTGIGSLSFHICRARVASLAACGTPFRRPSHCVARRDIGSRKPFELRPCGGRHAAQLGSRCQFQKSLRLLAELRQAAIIGGVQRAPFSESVPLAGHPWAYATQQGCSWTDGRQQCLILQQLDGSGRLKIGRHDSPDERRLHVVRILSDVVALRRRCGTRYRAMVFCVAQTNHGGCHELSEPFGL